MKKLIIAISSIWLLAVSSAMSMEFRPSIGISGICVYAATGIENNFNEGGTAIAETTKEYGAFATEFGSIFVEQDMVSIGVIMFHILLNTQNESGENESGSGTQLKLT